MTHNIKSIVVAALCASLALAAQALTLPHQISHNMVLQQNTKACLWGWADPGATVKITTSWNHKAIKISADSKGRWKTLVATPAASYVPQAITFEDNKVAINITNILIGEVWVASGQSNMEMPVKGFNGQPVDGSTQTIAYANQFKGKIRMATIPHIASNTPLDSVGGEWQECSPETVAGWSACAYYFAEALNKIIDVPVGIIHSSWGGSLLEEWMPAEAANQFSDIKVDAIKNLKREVSQDYNGMIHPLLNYTIRGFIWNQGESQVFIGDFDHAKHFAAFLKSWRAAFNQGDLPMYCVEIPGYHYGDCNGTMAPFVRVSQWQGAALAGNCQVVSTCDLNKPGYPHIIHGSIKQPIGERLAFSAAANTYSVPNLPAAYPQFKDITYNGKTAQVTFSNADCGWAEHNDLQGFEAAGPDKRFYPAKATATIDNSTISIVCDKVDNITAVRYCYKNWAIGGVHTTQGLPLVPFRTDNW